MLFSSSQKISNYISYIVKQSLARMYEKRFDETSGFRKGGITKGKKGLQDAAFARIESSQRCCGNDFVG